MASPQENDRPAALTRAPSITFSLLPEPTRSTTTTSATTKRSSPATSPSLRAQLGSSFSGLKGTFSSSKSPPAGATSPSLWSTALNHARSAKNPSTPSSPALRGMPPLSTRPNLETVTKALEDFRLEPPALCEGNDRAVARLTDYKTSYVRQREHSGRLLTQAMKARDELKPEVSRGLCWEIWQDECADVKTKVLACNILAQLAQSRSRSLDWFERADELVRKNVEREPSLREVAGVTEVMKQSICGEGVDERVRLHRRAKKSED